MRNKKVAQYLISAYSNKRLTQTQELQLETILCDALTYDGGAMEMSAFDDILDCNPDDSNWKTSYDWEIKKDQF